MMMKRIILASLLMVAIAPGGGLAGNPIAPGNPVLVPTIHAIGITLPYSGDDNGNATAFLDYRPSGAPTWRPGPTVYADRGTRQFAVSLFYLTPATAYDLRLTVTDSDGVIGPSTLLITATTRSDAPSASPLRTLYVSPNGSDANPGTFIEPWRTIQHAASMAEPGDRILLRGGVYYESVVLQHSGTVTAPIMIEPYPGETAILDGSDPLLLIPGNGRWQVYSGTIYVTEIPEGSTECDYWMRPGLVAQDGMRLFGYDGRLSSLDAFLSGPPGKWFYDCTSQRLYIELSDRSNPNDHSINVAILGTALSLGNAHFVHIRGLHVRFYADAAIVLGGISMGSDNNVIEGLTIQSIGRAGIRIGGSNLAPRGRNNLIQDNTISDTGYRSSGWTWDMVTSSLARTAGVELLYAGPGTIIRRNTVMGGYDGIRIGEGDATSSDVYDNTILDCMGQGIVLQPGAANLRVWGNTIDGCFNGIAAAPLSRGPVYLLRNLILGHADRLGRTSYLPASDPRDRDGYDTRAGIAVGGCLPLHDGRLFIYHTTLVNTSGTGLMGQTLLGEGCFQNAALRNNIIRTDDRTIGLLYANETINHTLDYDHLFRTSPGPLVQWGGTYFPTLANFTTATGQESHGQSSGTTLFTADYHLMAGSPEIDAGAVLPGINDDYLGQGPDLGAFEYIPPPSPTPTPTITPSPTPTGTPSPTASITASPTPTSPATPTPTPTPSPPMTPTPTRSPTPTPRRIWLPVILAAMA